VQLGGLALLIAAGLLILRPFLVAIAWAAILAIATWPTFRAVERHLGGRTLLAATVMTTVMIVVVVGPAVLVSVSLALEVEAAVSALRAWIERGLSAPAWVAGIPWVGPQLSERVNQFLADPAMLREWAIARIGQWARELAGAAGNLGRMLGGAIIALITLFFFYHHGAALTGQIGRIAHRLAGERAHAMIEPLGLSVRAVMYGMVFTALAQGGLAMIGYWAAGLGAPVLLGALTALASFLPLGAPLVWVPATLWLFSQGRLIAAFALLAWSLLVVGSVDNVIRSWFISGATRVPFILVFFAVLGGVTAFGTIGLFLGPIVIALLLGLWREWSAEAD
jgi:predicted PurR-regulated permease PerM